MNKRLRGAFQGSPPFIRRGKTMALETLPLRVSRDQNGKKSGLATQRQKNTRKKEKTKQKEQKTENEKRPKDKTKKY